MSAGVAACVGGGVMGCGVCGWRCVGWRRCHMGGGDAPWARRCEGGGDVMRAAAVSPIAGECNSPSKRPAGRRKPLKRFRFSPTTHLQGMISSHHHLPLRIHVPPGPNRIASHGGRGRWRPRALPPTTHVRQQSV